MGRLITGSAEFPVALKEQRLSVRSGDLDPGRVFCLTRRQMNFGVDRATAMSNLESTIVVTK